MCASSQVGVGGHIGFLPFSAANAENVKRVGVLQRFYVASIVEDIRHFVVMDPQVYRNSSSNRGYDGHSRSVRAQYRP